MAVFRVKLRDGGVVGFKRGVNGGVGGVAGFTRAQRGGVGGVAGFI